MEDKCIHGVDPLTCGYCNPIEHSWKKNKRELDELYVRYKTVLFRAEFENWSREEIDYLYDKFKNEALNKKKIYEAAIDLCRTKNAIVWMWKHIFSKNPYHRGKEVIKFRNELE